MTTYKEEEILGFIIGLLSKLKSNVGYPTYNYELFLNMESEEALKELSRRLIRMRDIDKNSKRDFRYYFSTELDYVSFLNESALAECLNVFFIMKKEKTPIPPIDDKHDTYGTDKEFSSITMGEMIPFRKWLKTCQHKKTKK